MEWCEKDLLTAINADNDNNIIKILSTVNLLEHKIVLFLIQNLKRDKVISLINHIPSMKTTRKDKILYKTLRLILNSYFYERESAIKDLISFWDPSYKNNKILKYIYKCSWLRYTKHYERRLRIYDHRYKL